jgi:hypothetical protein
LFLVSWQRNPKVSAYPEQIRSGVVLSTENLARHVERLERIEDAARRVDELRGWKLHDVKELISRLEALHAALASGSDARLTRGTE